MSSKINWKQKYFELRSKYMSAIDVSFRLGFEEGQKQAELTRLQQAEQQAQEMAAMGGALPPGAEGELPPGAEGELPPGAEGELPPEEMMVDEEGQPVDVSEDELGSSIDELEQYVKHEKPEFNFKQLLKSHHKTNTTATSNNDVSERQKTLNQVLKNISKE